MSWTFNIANWSFEADWEGLTVTPPSDDDVRRRKETERERALVYEPPAPDERENEAWA